MPQRSLGIVVVIPCYNEPDLISTLESLYHCEKPECAVEVLVLINDSERATTAIKEQNQRTYQQAKNWAKAHSSPRLQFYILYQNDLPHKQAGVGLARKIGMDEGVRRLELIDNSKGILVCYDADSLCQSNYLTEIERHFSQYPTTNACSIHFEHPIEGLAYEASIYEAIILYELHLRYFINAQKLVGFPFAYQTIGSSMAVRSEAYQKQGGMNRRKAGEDFYFLHKFIELGNFTNLKTTTVIPSPRISDRVPFGTGKAVGEMLTGKNLDTYNPKSFEDLDIFFKRIPSFYTNKDNFVQKYQTVLPEPIASFLKMNKVEDRIKEIKANTTNERAFIHRFYRWFNAFLLMKYVHFTRDNYYSNVEILEAVRWLLNRLELTKNAGALSSKAALQILRNYDKITF